MRLTLISLAAAAALGLAAPAALAETASHEGHAAQALALTLDNGAKWQGDDVMLRGMTAIRAALASRSPAIHDNTLPAGEYLALAAEVQAQVDDMVANCQLSPAVDEQFHMVLGQVLEGTAAMEAGTDARAGAVQIVEALNAYGRHFDHPGWEPLE